MHKHHVVTTINPETAVSCAAKGKFINSHDDNLIICKGSTIEIYEILNDGIKVFTNFNIFGVISSIQVCQLPNRSTCSLFLVTDQNFFTVLTYSSSTESIITEGHGILEEINARISDQPITTVLDIETNTVFISAFTGLLFSVTLPKTATGAFKPVPIRTHEFDITSMVSLKGIQQSAIATLSGEISELKYIKAFKYKAGANEIFNDEKLTTKVEATTHTLIAVPDPIGGVLAVGEYIISYHDLNFTSGGTKELSIDLVTVTAYAFINNSYDQCILGDSEGYLYLLTLETSNMKVTGINSTIIGQASLPNTIIDLGNNLLYIGSCQGDPCIVKLAPNPLRKFVVEVVRTFSNLGPIVDFCLFDYDGQGEQTMVCCSGVDKNGSLRIVENGVGFTERFILDIPLTSDIWTLGGKLLVVSTAFETIFLKPTSAFEMVEYQSTGALVLNDITLATALTSQNNIIQVTPHSVRLVSHEVVRLIAEWKPPNKERIVMAKVNASQCVLCYGTGMLVYLEIADNALIPTSVKQFSDIACINLSPKHENGTDKDYVTIGMCSTPIVRVMQLPYLNPVLELALQSISVIKDVLLVKLEEIEYFMVLLGDGTLLSYRITLKDDSAATLADQRQTMVGTYSNAMYPFSQDGQQKIFIAGIRPTIVSSWNQTLFFSIVNLKNVYALAPFDNMLVLMTDKGLLFGQTDTSQKLHHTKIELDGEMPSNIEYFPESKFLAVGTVSNQKDVNNEFVKRIGKIQILDAQTFKAIDSYCLPENEIVQSLAVAKFVAYPNQEYLFVGTIIEKEDDPDHDTGRILVFDFKENCQCELLDQVSIPGVVYNLKAFHNSVVASVNGSIYTLQKFQPDLPIGERIEFKTNLHNNVIALSLDTYGDRVLVGDLMQSVSVLELTEKDPLSLKLYANDTKPAWLTAVKFVSENVYIAADDKNNIFTVSIDMTRQPIQKPSSSSNTMPNGDVKRLALEGGYHIGSLINCFRQDILLDVLSNLTKHEDAQPQITATYNPFTFATIHGSIGTVKTISEDSFLFFKQIQECILREYNNIGGLDHTLWRNYKPTIHHNAEQDSNYLDGDLLKSFQQLNKFSKQRVVDGLSTTRYKVVDIEQFINTLVA